MFAYRLASSNMKTYLGLSPFPVIVTTRIVSCLVGNPNLNLHLPLAYWEGVPTTQDIPLQ